MCCLSLSFFFLPQETVLGETLTLAVSSSLTGQNGLTHLGIL